MSTTTKNIKVKISAEIDAFNKSMKDLSGKLQDASKEFSGLTKAGESITNLGKKFLPVTAGVAAIGAASAKTAMDFEAGMKEVSAISGATGKDLEKLEKVAIEMGKSTKFSSLESAEGLKYFAMAGYDVNSMVSALPATLALATAGNTSLAETCDIVSDAMTGMQMSSKRTGEFADIMAATTTSANTNISLMGETLKYVSPVAGAMGIEMKDLSVAIGLVGNAGIKGSQAGTALRSGLTNLVKPTKEMQKAMDAYGIELKKNEDGSINLMETMNHLRDRLGGLDQATQTATIATIFGKEAMSGWSAIINASSDDFNKLVESIYMSDEATRKLNKAVEYSGVEFEELETALDVVNETFGQGVIDADGLSVALGAMAEAGFVSADAGQALANGIGALSMPVKATQEAMAEYGIEIAKNDDGSMNLMGTIEELRKELGGLDEDTRKQALASIVGKENMEQWNAVISMSDDKFQELSGSISEVTGSAEEMKNTMSEGAKGAITEMGSALEEVRRTIGERLLPMIEKCADWVSELANKFLDLPENTQDAIMIFGALAAAIGPILMVVGLAVKAFGLMKVGALALGKPVLSLVGAFGGWGLAIVAVMAIIALAIAYWDEIKEVAKKVGKAIADAWKDLCENTKKWWNDMGEAISDWWNNLLSSIGQWFSDVGKWFSDGWNSCVDATTNFFSGLWNTISDWFNNLISTIGEWFSDIAEWFVDGWNTCVDKTKEVFTKISDAVSDAFEFIGNIVKLGFLLVLELFKAAILLILSPWITLWENIKDYVMPIFESVVNFISDKLEKIKSYVSEKLEAVKQFFTEKWNAVKDKTTEIYETIATAISEKLEKAKNYVSEKLEAVAKFFSEKWNNAKEKTTEAYDFISTKISDKLEETKGKVKEKTEAIKESIVEKWNNAKDKTSEVYQAISTAIASKLEEAKTKAIEKVTAIKNDISSKFEQAKSKVDEMVSKIREVIQSKLSSAKDFVNNTINTIKSKFDIFGTIASNVSSKFDNIKKSITDKMNTARDTVKNAIDKIKSFFNFNLSFPKIKVPVFGWTGKLSINPLSVPSFGIKDWKWLNRGGIFKKKTVLPSGYGVGDSHFGGVGTGAEAVLPIKKLPELLGLDKNQQNGGLHLNINEFNNNRDYDIEKLADELAYYLKRKKAFGGA